MMTQPRCPSSVGHLNTRFSSELQRKESCSDQERNVRRLLDSLGIDHRHAEIIRDEAVSGTKENRAGYARIVTRIEQGEPLLLAVDDQSRLSRGSMIAGLIENITFNGGRFVSGDGIDTDRPGWETLVGVHGIKNKLYIKDLADKVRRGQMGRVLDGNGSAGDLAFGYTSRCEDPEAALRYNGRGPKPKMIVVVNEDEAAWVRRIFAWFVVGKSIGWITRELTRLKVPKGARASTLAWHHHQVRRVLANPKYIGQWARGLTRTVRNATGRKKQIPAEEEAIVRCDRPSQRIIDQPIWDQAQRRLGKLKENYGYKTHQKRRGPKRHYTDLYPKSLLGGLLFCGTCGSRLTYQTGGKDVYYGCPNHRKGSCGQVVRVPRTKAENALLDLLSNALRADSAWVQEATASLAAALADLNTRVPQNIAGLEKQIAEAEKRVENLTAAIEQGGNLETLVEALKTHEQRKKDLLTQLAKAQALRSAQIEMPDDRWIADQLQNLSQIPEWRRAGRAFAAGDSWRGRSRAGHPAGQEAGLPAVALPDPGHEGAAAGSERTGSAGAGACGG